MVDEFRQAGIETGLVEYHEARWKKAVWNMPFNGMTVALHTQTDQLLKNQSTRQLIREQMMEVVSAAQHLGVKNLDESFVDKMIETTDAMTPYSPSMRLDYDFHRPMEIYYLYTRPLEIAREAGCPMPKLEMLEAELRFLEADQSFRFNSERPLPVISSPPTISNSAMSASLMAVLLIWATSQNMPCQQNSTGAARTMPMP